MLDAWQKAIPKLVPARAGTALEDATRRETSWWGGACPTKDIAGSSIWWAKAHPTAGG